MFYSFFLLPYLFQHMFHHLLYHTNRDQIMRVLLCLLYLVCAAMPSTASYFDGGPAGKCADGTEVSMNECLAGALEVTTIALNKVQYYVYDFPDESGYFSPSDYPCGCWIFSGPHCYTEAYFKDPADGNCNAYPDTVWAQNYGGSGNLVCQQDVSSSNPTTSSSNSPSSAPTFESVSHDLCKNFAVHARTTVTFDGVKSTVHNGDVGVYPGTSITGDFKFNNEGNATGAFQFEIGEVVENSEDFANLVVLAHGIAMADHDAEKTMEIEIGGKRFTPGIYRSGSAINFAHGTEVILDGNHESNPEFLFIAGSTLVTAADTKFNLINGAKAENVIWALGTAATLGARSHVVGSIMAGTAITFGTKSELQGCALAQSAVTFESEGSVVLNHYEADGIYNAKINV